MERGEMMSTPATFFLCRVYQIIHIEEVYRSINVVLYIVRPIKVFYPTGFARYELNEHFTRLLLSCKYVIEMDRLGLFEMISDNWGNATWKRKGLIKEIACLIQTVVNS